MVHAVHAAEGGENVRVGAYPTEGPLGRTVVGTDCLELRGELRCHATKGSSAKGFHDDTLHAHLLTFIIKVFGIGIVTATLAQGGMTPVEEIHLYLDKVPVVLILTVEEPVEIVDIAMIGESEVLDASGFTFLKEKVEDAIVEETPLERIHATADAVEQVVVDIVNLKAFHGMLIHAL